MAEETKKVKEKEVESLNLAEKIALANKDLGAVEKNGKNQGQGGWSYITEGDIKTAVRKVLGKYKFAIIPTEIKIIEKYERRSKSGGIFTFYDIQQTFDVTDGEEHFTGVAIGTGADNGDKALNKAMTICLKNFEKQLFNVSEKDDDPDKNTIEVAAGSTQPTQYKKVQHKPTKKAPNWSKPETVSDESLQNYTVNYTNGKPVLLKTILKHVREGNEAAKKFADSLKGNDATAYVELDKRTMAS